MIFEKLRSRDKFKLEEFFHRNSITNIRMDDTRKYIRATLPENFYAVNPMDASVMIEHEVEEVSNVRATMPLDALLYISELDRENIMLEIDKKRSDFDQYQEYDRKRRAEEVLANERFETWTRANYPVAQKAWEHYQFTLEMCADSDNPYKKDNK